MGLAQCFGVCSHFECLYCTVLYCTIDDDDDYDNEDDNGIMMMMMISALIVWSKNFMYGKEMELVHCKEVSSSSKRSTAAHFYNICS